MIPSANSECTLEHGRPSGQDTIRTNLILYSYFTFI